MKPISIPSHIGSLAPYVPGKPIEEVERELGLSGSVKLASNENPAGPSPKALAALREALEGVHRYPDGGGFFLKAKLSERTGLSPDRIVLGCGSTELVELLAKTFLGTDGNAVISEGAFVMYRIAVASMGRPTRLVPMTPDYRHDLEAMAEAVDARTRLVYIANPNNPTGTYVPGGAVDEFLGRVPEDVIVVLDEAYREYMLAGDYPDSMKHLSRGAALVVLRTFSKIYGLAGLRIGYALTRPDIAGALERVRSPFNTSSPAQAAALAALDDEVWVESSRRSNGEGLEWLAGELGRRGISFVPSVANFLLMFPGGDPTAIYGALMRQGVIVRPMGAFGFPSALRVSVGTPGENRRFVAALDACGARAAHIGP